MPQSQPAAAAATAAVTVTAAASATAILSSKVEPDERKEERERKHKKKERKKDRDEGEVDTAAAPVVQCSPAHRLRQAAADLRQAVAVAAEQEERPLVEALAAAVADLMAVCSPRGPPAALQRLQAQLQLHLSPPPAAAVVAGLPLAALALQAEAAAAAMERPGLLQGREQAEEEKEEGADVGPRFQRWFGPAFADCYSQEVGALAECDPPMPAGVLLHCVRLAAGSAALHPACHQRAVLGAGANGSGGGDG